MSAYQSPAFPHAARYVQAGQHGLFLVLLAVTTLHVWSIGAGSISVALAVAGIIAWYLFGVFLSQVSSSKQLATLWLMVLVMFWVVLVVMREHFAWLGFGMILLCGLLLPRPLNMIVCTAIPFVVIIRQLLDPPLNPMLDIGVPVIGGAVALGMALSMQAILSESKERGRLVQELTSAHEDLVTLNDALAESQREAGALAERARLAREIHDTLAQGFSSVLLLGRAAQTRLNEFDDGAGVRSEVDQIVETAQANLIEARRVVHALTPSELTQAPLPEALSRLVQRYSTQTGHRADFCSQGTPMPLPTAVDVALLRVAQGALANVRAHADAKRVQVTLTFSVDEVRLDIVDDGRGFDPESVAPTPDHTGYGIAAMRARMAQVGGSLDIESAPADGTAVVARIGFGENPI